MKRILAAVLLSLVSLSTVAQHRHHNHHYRPSHSHGHWVAPLIIGGVVGYAITRNNEPVVVQQPPVVVQPPAVMPAPVPYCTAWTEVLQHDGTILRQRTCTQ